METFARQRAVLVLAALCLLPNVTFAVVAASGSAKPEAEIAENSPAATAFRRGIQNLVDADLDAAQSAFEEAARLDPKIPQPLLGLADVALKRGRTQDAFDYLRRAEALAPRSSAVQIGFGRYYVSEGDLAKAQESLERAVQLQPSAFPARLELGNLYLMRGNMAEAARQFEQAIKVRPDSAQAQFGLGVALSRLNRPKEAESAFLAAARLAPEDVPTQQALARFYAEQKRYDLALRSIDRAIALAPKWPQLYVDRGDILAGKGDLIGAEAAYKQAIRLDPKNVAALNNAAWLLADRGAGLDEALDFARRATTLQPENALLSDTLGWVYRARKDFSNAIKAFERAIKLAPKLPEPHYHLGLALTDAGKAADARAEFERALKLGLGEPQASDARKRVALNTAR